MQKEEASRISSKSIKAKIGSSAAVIRLRGVRQHNLKNLDLDIPQHRLIAISGVSGSGKSSLAIHTLYAEGQRRYVETFSPYARQFLERMDRPDADLIEGIPPAIAIESATSVRSSRSTVGTITEINDHLKYLYTRLAVPVCPKCGEVIEADTPETVHGKLQDLEPGTRFMVCFPHRVKGKEWIRRLIAAGFMRVYADRGIMELEEIAETERCVSFGEKHQEILVVVDRLIWGKATFERVTDSLRTAFAMGKGHAAIVILPETIRRFSQDLRCASCDVTAEPKTPGLFSFNSPIGACPECRGFGRIIDVDMDLVVPDPRLSIRRGAIRPWTPDRPEYEDLLDFCAREGIPTDVPFAELSEEDRRKILEGTSNFYGIRGFFRWLERKTYKMHVRVFLSRYRAYLPCPACEGTRLRDAARIYRIRGVSLDELCSWPVGKSLAFFDAMMDELGDDPATELLTREIRNRLRFLVDVGLDYLTLDRQSRTLSGGEVQRVHLTRALGSALSHVLYVLDEPSVGLHARDQERLTRQLQRLVSLGNTVVFVEHDPDMISRADHVIDMGPGGGERGGHVLYEGDPAGLAKNKRSLTGRYLRRRGAIEAVYHRRRQPKPDHLLTVVEARENNLKKITVSFPLGCLIGISGVSGSGKSTLVETTLYNNWLRMNGRPGEKPGRCQGLKGTERITEMVLVDQRPLGRTPRANLLTYTKVLDPLRKLFASSEEARLRGYSPGHFSFNVPGGRCERCKGEGFQKVEMQFLADVYIRCPQCNGQRFRKEILDIRVNGLSMADVLQCTATELMEIFKENEAVRNALEPVAAIGLDYLKLGQPLNTLSGGEAQRLKLLRYLGKGSTPTQGDSKGVFFILDEPTVGLHPHDLAKLLTVLHRLMDQGHTVLVVEHNLDFLAACDWIIDLGPEGGDGGGTVVVEGPPEKVAETPGSHTGRFLKDCLHPPSSGTERHFKESRFSPPPPSIPTQIIVRGARVHNLNLDELRIPLGQMTVITGISGSGKSSLAFDILFAEGQRRYLECLSTYIRQYFKILEKPDVDQVLGLPPTVAIEQRMSRLGRKSTVGTITEIYHFLRLLFAKLGKQHCPECGKPVQSLNRDAIAHLVEEELNRGPTKILAPLVRGRKGVYRDLFMRLRRSGYRMVRIDGRYHSLDPIPGITRYIPHDIELVIADEEEASSLNRGDLHRKIALALRLGGGTLILAGEEDRFFSRHLICRRCERSFAPLDPRLFSFNSPHGACPRCDGTGVLESSVCPACAGTRLNDQARAVRIHGLTLNELTELPVRNFQETWNRISFSSHEQPISEPVSREIKERLRFMEHVGLGYLSLNRAGDTLSGGETQRIRLAAQLGSPLRGVCYILDEPTIGLHPVDNEKLLESLRALVERGNTVIVVEHDADTMRLSDQVVELGPGAGKNGGRLTAQGRLEDLLERPETLAARWFGKAPHLLEKPKSSKPSVTDCITVVGARANNLKKIDVSFPLQRLIGVTGVSGSGKSSLVHDVLKTALSGLRKGSSWDPKWPLDRLVGHEKIQRVVEVDHSPIGRTPRSTPATYVGIWNEIRRLFATLPESRARGFSPGRFSFNVRGGRCETCQGQGQIKVAMNFLPDVTIPCASCDGRRFNRETLSIKYKGASIADILQMTIGEARDFFASVPKILRPLAVLDRLGLGYLTLGQPSPTLSGGEAQRIKLAAELTNHRSSTLYLLDEPTTGLHRADVKRLVEVLRALVEQGHTVIVIEHNLDLIWACDYIVDLGPGSGDEGGRVVAAGPPEDLIRTPSLSQTATALRRHLALNPN